MTYMYGIAILFVVIIGLLYVPVPHGEGVRRTDVLSKPSTDAIKGAFMLGIMISHIATHVELSPSGTEEKLVYYALSFLGTAGVGVFFFFSGYGCYGSIGRTTGRIEVLFWLGKRLWKTIYTFWICLFTVYAALSFAGHGISGSELIRDALTFTMPFTTTWYLKIQVLLYLIIAFSFLCARKARVRIAICVALSVAYVAIAATGGLRDFWWNMTMTFPLGMTTAALKERTYHLLARLRKKPFIAVALGPVVILLYMNLIAPQKAPVGKTAFAVLCCSALVVFMVLFLLLLRPRNGIWGNIGTRSFELYLTHISLVSVIIDGSATFTKILLFFVSSFIMAYSLHAVIGAVTGLRERRKKT